MTKTYPKNINDQIIKKTKNKKQKNKKTKKLKKQKTKDLV